MFDLRTYASKVLVWRPQLARVSTAVHRERRPSRWRSELPWNVDRLQPARQRVRTSQVGVLRFLRRESERMRLAMFDCARTQVRFSFGGRSWHVGARPCTERDGRPAGAVGFHMVWVNSNQRSGARTRRKRACCSSSQERESARGWRIFDLRTYASKLLVWRPRLARGSTPVHRGNPPSCWRSGLP
jgi:hypothetical protein